MTTLEKEINKALTCKYSNRRKRAIKNVYSYISEHYSEEMKKIVANKVDAAEAIEIIDKLLASAPEEEQLTANVVKKEDERKSKKQAKDVVKIDVKVDSFAKAQEVAKENGIELVKDNRFKNPKINGTTVLLGEKFFETNTPTSEEFAKMLIG